VKALAVFTWIYFSFPKTASFPPKGEGGKRKGENAIKAHKRSFKK